MFEMVEVFRKELLSIALWGPNEVDILEMLHSSEVQIRLSAFPISHENGSIQPQE